MKKELMLHSDVLTIGHARPQSALECDPGYTPARFHASQIYHCLGRLKDAYDGFTKVSKQTSRGRSACFHERLRNSN
jgi:hypothetical protein